MDARLCSARQTLVLIYNDKPFRLAMQLVQISNFTANPHNGLSQRQWGKLFSAINTDSEVMRLESHARRNTIPAFHLADTRHKSTALESCDPSRRRPPGWCVAMEMRGATHLWIQREIHNAVQKMSRYITHVLYQKIVFSNLIVSLCLNPASFWKLDCHHEFIM